MTASEASGRIAFLVAEINRHDRLYYVEAKPVIGDRECVKLKSMSRLI